MGRRGVPTEDNVRRALLDARRELDTMFDETIGMTGPIPIPISIPIPHPTSPIPHPTSVRGFSG